MSRELSAVLDVEDPIPQAYSASRSARPASTARCARPRTSRTSPAARRRSQLAVPLQRRAGERRNFKGILRGVDGRPRHDRVRRPGVRACRSPTSITPSSSPTGTPSCTASPASARHAPKPIKPGHRRRKSAEARSTEDVMEAKLDMVLEQVGRDKNIDKSRAGRDARAGHPHRRQAHVRHAPRDGGEVQRGDRPRRPVPDRQRRRGGRRDRGPRDHRRRRPRRPASRPSSATSCCSRSSIAPRTTTAPTSRTRSSATCSTSRTRLQEVRPHRRADRQAGHLPARARGRARERLQRVQGPQGRAHLRHRAPLRARQHSSSTSAAPRRCCRCASRCRASRYRAGDRIKSPTCVDIDKQRARPADHPVAHAQGPAREAVRDGGPRDLREDRAHRGLGPRAGRAREDRRAARATATSTRSAPASA